VRPKAAACTAGCAAARAARAAAADAERRAAGGWVFFFFFFARTVSHTGWVNPRVNPSRLQILRIQVTAASPLHLLFYTYLFFLLGLLDILYEMFSLYMYIANNIYLI